MEAEAECNYICGVGLGEVQEARSVGVGTCRGAGDMMDGLSPPAPHVDP